MNFQILKRKCKISSFLDTIKAISINFRNPKLLSKVNKKKFNKNFIAQSVLQLAKLAIFQFRVFHRERRVFLKTHFYEIQKIFRICFCDVSVDFVYNDRVVDVRESWKVQLDWFFFKISFLYYIVQKLTQKPTIWSKKPRNLREFSKFHSSIEALIKVYQFKIQEKFEFLNELVSEQLIVI